jgi:hypothetical protein
MTRTRHDKPDYSRFDNKNPFRLQPIRFPNWKQEEKSQKISPPILNPQQMTNHLKSQLQITTIWTQNQQLQINNGDESDWTNKELTTENRKEQPTTIWTQNQQAVNRSHRTVKGWPAEPLKAEARWESRDWGVVAVCDSVRRRRRRGLVGVAVWTAGERLIRDFRFPISDMRQSGRFPRPIARIRSASLLGSGAFFLARLYCQCVLRAARTKE